MKPLVILTGPTAVGKTSLSVQLAKRIGGEIISADALQVYKHMDIGTAKVTSEEMDGVKHHLIDILEPSEEFSVADFKEKALEALDMIYNNNHIPIIAGGTGFYIQALLYDVDFKANEASADSDDKLRQELRDIAMSRGSEYLHSMLADIDSESAAAIHHNNVKRVIRAIEYYRLTGKKISEHNKEQKAKEANYNFAYYVLNDDRDILYERINKRVDIMVENGLLAEMDRLLNMGITRDNQSMQAIGYRELFDYYDGVSSLDEAIMLIKQNSRRYAKRQLTWFRGQEQVQWFDYKTYREVNPAADVKELILQDMIADLKLKKIIE